MNYCKYCGIQHPEAFNYCPTEAGALAVMPAFDISRKNENYCPSCGKGAHSTAEYCIHCGSSFSNSQPKTSLLSKSVTTATVNPVSKAKDTEGLTAIFSLSTFSKRQIVPVLISVLFTFALLVGTIVAVKSSIDDLLISSFNNEFNISELSTLEPLAELINRETEEEMVSFPPVYNFFTFIPWIHAIDFELSTTLSYESERSSALLTFQNMSVIFIPLLILIFGLGGWVLGWQIKKHNLPFFSSLVLFSLGYALLVLISTIIAAFSLKARVVDFWGDTMQFALTMNYSWFEAFFVPLLIALLLGGLFAHFAIFKKQSFAQQAFVHSVFHYGALALTTLIGLSILFHVFSFVIGSNLVTFIENEDIEGRFLVNLLFGAPIAFMLLKAGHFIPSIFSINAFDERETVSLKLWETDQFLMSDFASGLSIDEWLFTGFPFWYHLLFLVPVIALAASGYFLFKTVGINWIEIGIFSSVYALLFLLITSIGNINLVTTAGDYNFIFEVLPYRIDISLTSTPMTTFFFSFVVAAVSITAGMYLRKFMLQRA